jgi:hypothetical protein
LESPRNANIPAALVCAVLDAILWEQPKRYDQSQAQYRLLSAPQLNTDGPLIAGWTRARVLFPKGETGRSRFNQTTVRVKFTRLSCTKAKQFNVELDKQARHLLERHYDARLTQLTSEAQKSIEKDFGAWLAFYIVTHNFTIPEQLDLRKMLLLAWDINVPVAKKEHIKEEHVEASFVMKIVQVLNSCLCIRPTCGIISVWPSNPRKKTMPGESVRATEASQMILTKLGLAEWAVVWIVYQHKPARRDKSGHTENDLRLLAPAFICLFFPGDDVEKVSRTFGPLVALIE